MLRDCVWSRFGQLSTFQKDLSPAAGKKRSEDGNPCLRSGEAAHLCFFLSETTYEDLKILRGKKELCVWVVLWGVRGRGRAFFLSL